jgi:hypothetical protein
VKLLSFAFQPAGDYIELVGISDLHYGSSNFLPKKAEKHRSYIVENSDRRCIDMGDSTENALRSSPGSSVFRQTCPPSEQREWVREFYRPIKDRTLAVVCGNHGDRSEKDADFIPDETLASFIDCPLIRWEGVLVVTVGDSRHGQQYTIYTRHAISQSSKPAQIMNAMFNKSRSVQGLDAYWFAHNHMFLTTSLPCQIVDTRHGKIKVREQVFLMGDSFMSYDESYADQYGYPLPTAGQASIRLYKDTHRVEVQRLVYS